MKQKKMMQNIIITTKGYDHMTKYLKGMTTGIIAGAAVTMMAIPMTSKVKKKTAAGRAMQAVGEIVEQIGCAMKE